MEAKFGPLGKKENKKLLPSVEIKFFRTTAGYTLFDNKRNEEILEELTVEPVIQNQRRHKSNCLRHVTRMNNRIPNAEL
jgi:hypothetical protein